MCYPVLYCPVYRRVLMLIMDRLNIKNYFNYFFTYIPRILCLLSPQLITHFQCILFGISDPGSIPSKAGRGVEGVLGLYDCRALDTE